MKTDLQLFMDGLTVNKHAREIEKYVLKTKFKRVRKNGMTVYTQDNFSDKAVVFVSGGAVLTFTHYLQKLIDDLHIKNSDILVFENLHTFNLTCIDKIATILQTMHYSELVIIGCSMGGVIGSHIISKLNHLDIKKKLICIDTPFHIHSTIPLAFENKGCIWRPDIYSLYKFTIELVQGNYNYTDVFKITSLEQYKRYVSEHFGITDYEYASSANPLVKNCKIINVYNADDPVVIRHYNIPTIVAYKRNLDKTSTFKEVHISYNRAGHCTEWANDCDVKRIVRQLRKFI